MHFRNGDVARCPADDNVQHFAAAGDRRPTIDEVDPDRVYYDDPHGVGGLKYPFYFGLEPYAADRHAYWPDYLFRTIDLVHGGGRWTGLGAQRDLLALDAVDGVVRLRAGADVPAR